MSLPVLTPMAVSDLDAIMPLERLVFRDPWSRHMYLTDLTTNELATYRVLRSPEGVTDAPILAYGGFWLLADEAHIATVASHPDYRGCGLGQFLMWALIDAAVARGAGTSTLEVREGNTPARTLYAKLGYEVVGERRRYYRDGENALIMTTKSLSEPAQRERLIEARDSALVRLAARFTGPEATP